MIMATRVTIKDGLRPETTDWLERGRLEHLREQGRYRDLALWMLGCEEAWQPEANGVFQTRVVRVRPVRREPTPEDLAEALREESPDRLPAPIREYIVTRYLLESTPRKTGPQRPTRSTGDDDRVFEVYTRLQIAALGVHEADDSPATRNVKTRTKDQTAKQFVGIKGRTIDTILASRRMLKSPPK
jgi:hypothetical protein